MRYFMDRKNALGLSFGLVMVLTGFPLVSHASEQSQALSQAKKAQTGTPLARDTQRSPLPMTPEERTEERDAQHTITGPYRITYTITEMDGARRIGSKQYRIVLDAGREHGQSHLKLGSRVPIATNAQATSKTPIQFTYVDIGIEIRASLLKVSNGLELSTHVNQSSIDSQDSSSKGIAPVIREVSFDSSALLQENKPIQLGTVAISDSTHVLQIQVELTKVQ